MRKLFLANHRDRGNVIENYIRASWKDLERTKKDEEHYCVDTEGYEINFKKDDLIHIRDAIVTPVENLRFKLVERLTEPSIHYWLWASSWARNWKKPTIFIADDLAIYMTLGSAHSSKGAKEFQIIRTTASDTNFKAGNMIFFTPSHSSFRDPDSDSLFASTEGNLWERKDTNLPNFRRFDITDKTDLHDFLKLARKQAF